MRASNLGLSLLGLLLLTLGAFFSYAIYDMAVAQHFYTPQLTILVSAMSGLSLMAGVGTLTRKKWAFSTFVAFAVILLAGMLYTNNFVMEPYDSGFIVFFLLTSVLLFLASSYLRRKLGEKL